MLDSPGEEVLRLGSSHTEPQGDTCTLLAESSPLTIESHLVPQPLPPPKLGRNERPHPGGPETAHAMR